MELINDIVHIEYGRVGASGTTTTKSGGIRQFNKILQEKLKKGYVETAIDLEAGSATGTSNIDVMSIALSQIDSDTASQDLIKTLVNKNIHNIVSNTKITFNMDTGMFKTPLGVVTRDGVLKAKVILNKLRGMVDDTGIKKPYTTADIMKYSTEYYSIIPTTLSNLRDISAHLYCTRKVEAQDDICDALLQTIDLVEQGKVKALDDAKKDNSLPVLFNTKLRLLDDSKEFQRISDYFEKSKNQVHGRRTSGAKISRIFTVNIDKDDKAYRHDMPNQMELWHGTKVANLLSILKSGLLMPKYSPGAVTGYMFGQGLYFSNQSSKSLNYCDGGYWNNSQGNGNKIYMFVVDIAMGNYLVPKGSTSQNPPSGYDSYWAQPGKSGIMNDEMIVFKNEQIKLKYLLEIEVS